MATTVNEKYKLQDIVENTNTKLESDHESDDDDGDLEEMVERYTAKLSHSVSAHANLTAPRSSVKKPRSAAKSCIIEENSEDSDEEFYIHKTLEPLRKSKSCYTTSKFASKSSKEQMTVAEKIDFSKGDVLTFRIVPTLHPGAKDVDSGNQSSDDEPVGGQRRCWSEPNDSKNPSEVCDLDSILVESDLHELGAGREKREMEHSWSSPSRFEVSTGPNSVKTASFEPFSTLNGSKPEEKGASASQFSPHRLSKHASLDEDRMSTSSDESNLTESDDEEGAPETEIGQIAPLLGQISTNRLINLPSCSVRSGIGRPPCHSATFTGSAVEENPGTLMKLGELRQSLARKGGFQRSASAFAGSLAQPMLKENSWLRPFSMPKEVETASVMSPFAPNFNEAFPMADEDAPSLWMPVVISKAGDQKFDNDNDNGNESTFTNSSEEVYYTTKRASPPLAVSDELSESQISELEREIEEHGLAQAFDNAQYPDVQDEEWEMNDELVLDREATLTDTWPISHQMAQSCYYPRPGEEGGENEDEIGFSTQHPIAWSTSTPCFGQEELSVSVKASAHGQGRRRRVLPKLPHERETTPISNVLSQVVATANSSSSSEQVTSNATQTPKRRLPDLPKDKFHHKELEFPHCSPSILTPLRPSKIMDLPESSSIGAVQSVVKKDMEPQALHTLDPDASPITPHALMRNALAMIIEQNGHHTHQHHENLPPTAIQGQYQLSYGLASSSMAESSITSSEIPEHSNSRKPNRYGLMEDSYYEDGLNGNLVPSSSHGWPVPLPAGITPSNSGEAMRTAGDSGAESSGISSCCTSHTNENNSKGNNGDGLGTGRHNDPNVPTHRAQFPFVPRHSDELRLEMGDPIYVHQLDDDHWCSGTNLRTQQNGIFPSAHICEVDLVEEICHGVLPPTSHPHTKPSKYALTETDTFYLTLLASIEVAHHKGNDVLTQAIGKVCAMYQQKDEIMVPQTVLMEISFRGIHVIDKRKKDFFRCPTFDYFYSLQNISFCGAHPKQLRYFGFITKHPLLPRFACHVFLSQDSTQPIVEAIGRAFKRSYDEYMAFAHPTEDIFIE